MAGIVSTFRGFGEFTQGIFVPYDPPVRGRDMFGSSGRSVVRTRWRFVLSVHLDSSQIGSTNRGVSSCGTGQNVAHSFGGPLHLDLL